MFNKSEIMKRAWEIVKERGAKFNRINMRYAMYRAWGEAKKAVAMPLTAVEQIRAAISMLQNKTRWTQTDYARNDALYQELRAA